ncbi:MAG: tRNA glutamyl-Q(34) synthetase GluQRS, partial [Verrucomicrobia bacterium]|nr:tRNA glutamyl-Q(34) synthetase GluQRS [Verrucomicrobiota bacterium]
MNTEHTHTSTPFRTPRGRLVPSPTGALHLGNARTFLLTWLSIRSQSGSLVFRMEDLDHPKVKAGAAQQALDDLEWLGLDWDEGPGCEGAFGPYVQSARVPMYRQALDKLISKGIVYPCVCSRSDVEHAQSAPHAGEDGTRYSGACRDRFQSYAEAARLLPPDRLPAWRFRTTPGKRTTFVDGLHGPQSSCVHDEVGDFVIARHAEGAGYMLAVVVDDAAMGVTEVMRGDDLIPATHRQILLAQALDLPLPAYIHVPLMVGLDGRRLAKRHGDTRISALRKNGVAAETIIAYLAASLDGSRPALPISATSLLDTYALGKIPKHAFVHT